LKKAHLITAICTALVTFSAAAHAQVRNPWNGFYVGLHGGYAWQDVGATFNSATPADYTVLSGDLNGGIVGGQLGYNYQSGQFLLGLEADISTLANGGRTATYGAGTPDFESVSLDASYIGSVRGRLGWAINNWLLYGTVGWGYSEFKFDARDITDHWRIRMKDNGVVYGGGIEWMLAYGVSLRAEYLRYDLGRTAPMAFIDSDPGDHVRFDNIDVVRAALNIKLSN